MNISLSPSMLGEKEIAELKFIAMPAHGVCIVCFYFTTVDSQTI